MLRQVNSKSTYQPVPALPMVFRLAVRNIKTPKCQIPSARNNGQTSFTQRRHHSNTKANTQLASHRVICVKRTAHGWTFRLSPRDLLFSDINLLGFKIAYTSVIHLPLITLYCKKGHFLTFCLVTHSSLCLCSRKYTLACVSSYLLLTR